MEFCEECLKNEFIKESIAVQSEKIGDCNICGSDNVRIIDIGHLHELLTPILDLYIVNPDGKKIIELLRDDWLLFKNIDNDRLLELLRNAKYGDNNLEWNYVPLVEQQDVLDWSSFKKELKHNNRFFPKSFPNHDELASLMSYLSFVIEARNQTFYRARIIKSGDEIYAPENMGAPPPELASHGRANPFGISYLYVASTENTAVSEVRPHNGERLAIARFNNLNSLKLVDLRNPRQTLVPFRYSEDSLKNIYKGLALLETLGVELTKPVSQDKAPLEYLSSQYLCEFIKSQQYDGVIYKSSLGDSDNYAIFNESHLECHEVIKVKVSETKITHVAC
ncbi:RES domain-containing protein [Pseudoalteromonas sp. SR44-5]|uniref:RES domain-containing protein n=1 Tax=Pseudoalteromonas sp. SR44-5 TaxID=2760934 RepID=UPI00160205BA|nr:RES domain-containing protein [Pseudoalteromonas sp. SR44-5]MBB1367730.1 RES domain-containing protein [Pseudoalteromonas sp. SR44-5]